VEKRQVNPWTWQERAGFSQAWRVEGAGTIVFVSGQVSVSPEGEVVGEGDFEAQVRQVFENLQTVLEQAGASLESVVKIGVYLTEIEKLRDFGRIRAELMPGPPPASTVVQVVSLALPQLQVEVEAIAVV
jgi:2-iminobutanoate/2-iminopropanoate deaminase